MRPQAAATQDAAPPVLAPKERALQLSEQAKGERNKGIASLVAGLVGCFVAPPAGAALLVYGLYKCFQWYNKSQAAKDPEAFDARKDAHTLHRDKAIKRGVEATLSLALGFGSCFFGPPGIVAGLALMGFAAKKAYDCRKEYQAMQAAPLQQRMELPGTFAERALSFLS